MKCHKINYKIFGDDLQLVEVELDPAQTVIAEAGSMNYIDDGVSIHAKMGDGSKIKEGFFDKVINTGARALTGTSVFLTHFTNITEDNKKVSFSAPYPGTVLPLDMSNYNNEVICQKSSFLAAAFGTTVSLTVHKKVMTGLFGGEGFILQKLLGDGMCFLHGGGTIIQKELTGNTLRVDTGCLMAFTKGIKYSIQRAGSIKSMLFAGEGLFLATLKGHGTVWLQSLPFARLKDSILSGYKKNKK